MYEIKIYCRDGYDGIGPLKSVEYGAIASSADPDEIQELVSVLWRHLGLIIRQVDFWPIECGWSESYEAAMAKECTGSWD